MLKDYNLQDKLIELTQRHWREMLAVALMFTGVGLILPIMSNITYGIERIAELLPHSSPDALLLAWIAATYVMVRIMFWGFDCLKEFCRFVAGYKKGDAP